MSDDLVQTGEAVSSDSPAPESGGDAEITSIIESAAADLTTAEPAPSTEPRGDAATPGSQAPAAEAAPTPSSPSKAEDAELQALEQELIAKDPRLKTGKGISSSHHQAVLTRTRRQYEAAMAEAARKLEAVKQYEAPEFKDRLRAFQIAEQNPDQFLQILQAIPEYRARIDALVQAAAAERAGTMERPEPEAEEEEEPQPDTLLEGGGMGYSTERANQLWAYRLRQLRAEQDQKLAALEEHLKPIQEDRQTQQVIQQAYQRQGGILADARQHWPLFSQYEGKIRAELSKPGNERMQLDQAYRVVVVQAERADRARIEAEARAKIQQEMNGQAKSPRSLRPGFPPAETRAESGDGEIETIIRNAARSLG
jgi:hypothetical protein